MSTERGANSTTKTAGQKAQALLASLDQTLEKAGLGRALSFFNETASGTRKILANERILTQLRRVGLASQEDLDALQSRVATLEAEILRLEAKLDAKA